MMTVMAFFAQDGTCVWLARLYGTDGLLPCPEATITGSEMRHLHLIKKDSEIFGIAQEHFYPKRGQNSIFLLCQGHT